MPGDTSKTLVSKCTSRIGMSGQNAIKNAGVFYSGMSEAQELFMREYKTSLRDFRVELSPGTYEYDFTPRMFQILSAKAYSGDEDQATSEGRDISNNIKVTYPEYNPLTPGAEYKPATFIMPYETEIEAGTYVIVKGYLAPMEGEVIDASTDPVIEPRYHDFLVQYAIAPYKDDKELRHLKSMKDILAIVERMSNTTYRPVKAQLLSVGNTLWQGDTK